LPRLLAPLGSVATRNLSRDHGRPKGSFGRVVRSVDTAVAKKREEVPPPFAQALSDLEMIRRCRGVQEAIRPTFEATDQTDVFVFGHPTSERMKREGTLEEHLRLGEKVAVRVVLRGPCDGFEVMRVDPM
jgi:hypothetical protein